MPSTEPTNPTDLTDSSAFGAAYQRRLPEIVAVPDGQLVPINIDFYGAVTTILGSLPELQPLTEQMKALPGVDVKLMSGVEDYAQAAAEANVRYAIATEPREDISTLHDEAMQLRETLRSDATALAHRGLIDEQRLSSFKGLVGYKNVGFELIEWANLLAECWAKIEGKTALTAAEIQHAKDVGERLVRAAGERDQGPTQAIVEARVRQQAFTLMVRSYDQVRRAVSFLRWNEGDANEIAPSLYAGRTRKSSSSTPELPNSDVPPPAAAPAGPVSPMAPGMPGASPFSNS